MTIPEVKAVQFEAGDPPGDSGARKVTLFSDQGGLTKDDAVKALGKKATRYVVTSWTAPAPEPAEGSGGA